MNGRVARFIAAAQETPSINALHDLVEDAVKALGIDHFALIHHVSIFRAGSNTVFVHNYPEDWAATLHVRGYLIDDPLAEICRRHSAPFLWSDIPTLIDMSRRQREIMREAAKHGLVNGYTVPIHWRGDPVGSCSFSTKGPLPLAALADLRAIGTSAFEAVRRLVRRDAPARAATARPRLTALERECLLLAGRGTSDRGASEILGIPEAQVTRHIEQARRKFGAANRIELIVRALYRSELRFEELIEVDTEVAGIAHARRNRVAMAEPVPMLRLGALFFGENPELN